jgi:hypothetical protein
MLNTPNDAVGAAQQPWPRVADHPLPSPIDAGVSASKLIASGLFAFLLAGMIGIILRENALSAEPYEGWKLWLRIAAAIGIAALGGVILISGIKALVKPAALVSMHPDGLLVPSLYERTVPWSEVQVVIHDKPRVKLFGPGKIVIGVRDGARFGRIESPELKPALAPDGLDAAQLPQVLTVPVEQLLRAIDAHRAHFGHDGAAST